MDSRSVAIYIVWFYACLIRSSDPNSKENKIQEHFTEEDKCGKTRDWDAAVNRSMKLNKNRGKKNNKQKQKQQQDVQTWTNLILYNQ